MTKIALINGGGSGIGRAYNIACGQIDTGNTASDMASAMGAGVPQADLSI